MLLEHFELKNTKICFGAMRFLSIAVLLTWTCTDPEKKILFTRFINFKAVFLNMLKWLLCEYFKHDFSHVF